MKGKIFLVGGFFGVALAAFLIFGLGCSDDDPVQSDDPLTLPPLSSFVMDFDDFGPQEYAGVRPTKVSAGDNWGYSAFNVGVWNAIITIGLAIPVASFVESFKHEAVLQSDGSWQWTYNFIAGTVHTAKLNGKINGDQIDWNMYISKLDQFTDFLWFSGASRLDGSYGTWTLNNNPDNPTPLLGIIWNYNASAGTSDLKYTNIVPEGPENGGYIYYGLTDAADFDRFYDIYNKGLDNLTEIEWNFTTKVGRVKDENQFGDILWHCWDATLQDVACE